MLDNHFLRPKCLVHNPMANPLLILERRIVGPGVWGPRLVPKNQAVPGYLDLLMVLLCGSCEDCQDR